MQEHILVVHRDSPFNQLAVSAHQQIYGTRRERKSRLVTFFRDEVPVAFHNARRYFFYALVTFLGAIALGWLSGVLDPAFFRMIVGDHYVNQTLENIRQGDPLAIYKESESGAMFFMISTNNIRVAFIAFIASFGGSVAVIII
jgi:uncharacterized membrane protein SpoIIM required for sporulation